MIIEQRKQFLKDSIKAAAVERAYQDRVAALAQPAIDKIIAQQRAETSKPLSCRSCGEPLPESWRTDDVTSVSDNNQDDVNEQDDDDDDGDDNSDDELDAKGKSRLVAQIVARKRRR